ncbi:MAG TPA: long-chain fatty acid--CoA ligase, partial [Deltaproteobacteria bacterium]|nr:long-chain fatty acid--CoA ligase [Deltaproteobacteria bacterium]
TLKAWRIGTVGRPLKGVEVRIAEDGEVLVRGASVMKGYFNLPELTAQTIREGWLHTGDTGHIDEQGFLVITGRKKDIIITSAGKNITPQKIENLLREDPYIKDAILYGDQKPHLVALVIPDTERLESLCKELGIEKGVPDCLGNKRLYSFFEKRIRERLSGLSRFEQIHRFALIADDLSCERGELTPTMKLKREAIARRYSSLIDSLY